MLKKKLENAVAGAIERLTQAEMSQNDVCYGLLWHQPQRPMQTAPLSDDESSNEE